MASTTRPTSVAASRWVAYLAVLVGFVGCSVDKDASDGSVAQRDTSVDFSVCHDVGCLDADIGEGGAGDGAPRDAHLEGALDAESIVDVLRDTDAYDILEEPCPDQMALRFVEIETREGEILDDAEATITAIAAGRIDVQVGEDTVTYSFPSEAGDEFALPEVGSGVLASVTWCLHNPRSSYGRLKTLDDVVLWEGGDVLCRWPEDKRLRMVQDPDAVACTRYSDEDVPMVRQTQAFVSVTADSPTTVSADEGGREASIDGQRFLVRATVARFHEYLQPCEDCEVGLGSAFLVRAE